MNNWLKNILQGDILYLTLLGMLTPVFALFLKDQIPNANLITISIAEAIYLLTIGILRPFTLLSTNNDRQGWRTQNLLWFGSALIIITPFLYLLSRDIVDIFIIQFLYGIGISFSEPAWIKLTKQTKKISLAIKFEQFSNLGTLLSASLVILGGYIAQHQGMRALFFYIGITLIFASILMILLYSKTSIRLKKKI